jgi:hypothetical protein
MGDSESYGRPRVCARYMYQAIYTGPKSPTRRSNQVDPAMVSRAQTEMALHSMRKDRGSKMSAVALVLWLQTAPLITNDGEGKSRTITQEMAVSAADLPSGAWHWLFRTIQVPRGCENAKYEVEVLEAFPEPPSGWKYLIYDSSHSGPSYHPDGWNSVISIGIAAHRDHTLPPGPASTNVRVRLSAICNDSAYEKLREKFLISGLDFT